MQQTWNTASDRRQLRSVILASVGLFVTGAEFVKPAERIDVLFLVKTPGNQKYCIRLGFSSLRGDGITRCNLRQITLTTYAHLES